MDRLTSVAAGGVTTSYTYDAAGNTLSQMDGRGNATRWEYNARNQPALRADPGGTNGAIYDESRIERYTYRADGKLLTSRDKNGATTAYAYDIHGRKTSESVGGAAATYQYDAAGNLLSVSDASGAITRAYDALGRVTSKTVPTFGATTFAYDITAGLPAGFVGESTAISGRTVTKVYDKADRLAQVKDGAAVTSYAYYANGSLQTQTLPNGVTANYAYHADNRLHTLQNKAGGGVTLEAYQYAYDGAGNLAAKQDIKGTTTYAYTSRNQLATVSEPSGKQTAYTYDASGNRQSEMVTEGGAAVVTQYTVNSQNRLTKTEQTTAAAIVVEQYHYDDAGNLLGRQPETYATAGAPVGAAGVSLAGYEDGAPVPAVYVYNARNQMTEATNGGGTVVSAYNAEGLRISKEAGGVTTRYCYEYSRVIKEQ
jgi:YD repeat-containing protein